MTGNGWTILHQAGRWRLGRLEADGATFFDVEAPVDGTPADAAAAIQATLAGHGYLGEGVVLGLESAACLAADIQLDAALPSQSRQVLSYELEQWLPLAAEDMVADYVFHGQRALGVAVEVATVAALIEALESHEITVQTIAPTSLLALQSLSDSLDPETSEVILWYDESRIALFCVNGGKPARWLVLPPDPILLAQNLQVLALEQEEPLKVVALNLSDPCVEGLTAIPDVELKVRDESGTLADSAIASADAILAGRLTPWIELRRDALASQDPYRPVRGLLRLAHVVAALLLVALAGTFFWRGSRYERLTEEYKNEQVEIFQQVLPGQRIPVGIRSRLKSEYARLAGLRGEASDTPFSLPSSASAVRPFFELLSGLPDSLRFRLLEIRIERDRVALLQGESNSHKPRLGLVQVSPSVDSALQLR